MTGEGSLAMHRRSNFWAGEAERRLHCGRPAAARRCYIRAAEWERRTFEAIPLERPRTRGIIGRSAYWLLVKAGKTAEAIEWRARLTADPTIPAFAICEMEGGPA